MIRSAKMPNTILLLDDEYNNLVSFKATFKEKYSILTASSIKDAMDILDNKHVDVFISDQRMPDGNGLDTIQEVRTKYPQIVCMLMTAYDELKLVHEAINQGHVYYYITKPWDEDQLNLVLVKALEKAKSVQELNFKTEALEKAYYELDKLVYSASHDMRTPLSSILGLSRLIRREFQGQDSALKYVDLIEESTDRMIGVLDALSEYSELRINEVVDSTINLKRLAQDVVQTALERNLADGQEVKTNFNYTGDDYLWLPMRKMRLLMNKIVENAFQYANSDEKIHVVDLDIVAGDELLTIEISDNGQGMLPNKVHEIFNLFYRGSNQSRGIGMGLYLAQEIVSIMEGTIQVKSEPDQGTSFTIQIPLKYGEVTNND
jgi:signal transduction histidine kinase